MVQPLWRAVQRFPKKLKIELLYDPSAPLLGIYPEAKFNVKGRMTAGLTAALHKSRGAEAA